MDDFTYSLLIQASKYYFIIVLLIYPLWRIFKRVGRSPFESFIVFIPFAGFLIAMTILAFGKWPSFEKEDA